MTRVKRWRSVVWVVAACLLQAAAAAAQAQPKAKTGSVDGVVSTQDGSVRLPGATVAIYNSAGEQVAEQLTNAEGTFTALELQPDIYRFVSSLMGFRPAETKVAVTAGGPIKVALDILLRPSPSTWRSVRDRGRPTGDTIAPTSGVTGKELDQFRAAASPRAAAACIGDHRAGRREHQGRPLQPDRCPDGRGQPHGSHDRRRRDVAG